MAHITGTVADENDNDPVEVRGYQILGSALDSALGYPPSSPIYHRGGTVDDNKFWRYYPNGMIASSENTCAEVLYGPIFDAYDAAGEFDGPLGFPTTDITALPDGTSYAAFDGGVLWIDHDGVVQQLTPLPPGLVSSFSGGIDPSAAGIAAVAQQKIEEFAANALASNKQLADNVDSITATVTFDSVGPGGCAGAGFSSAGTTLMRSHIFRVHLDISLKGCAGVFGGANADMHVCVRLSVGGGKVSAFLQWYTIDGVGSPFGAGDDDIRNGLTQSLNSEYGHDLLNQQLPSGVVVLAANVGDQGDVRIFIEPLCSMSTLSAKIDGSLRGETLHRLRVFRDDLLSTGSLGSEFNRIIDVFGPGFVDRLARQEDAQALGGHVAAMLVGAVHVSKPKHDALKREVLTVAERLVDAEKHARAHPTYVSLVLERAIKQLRHAAAQGQDLTSALAESGAVFERDRDDDDRHVRHSGPS